MDFKTKITNFFCENKKKDMKVNDYARVLGFGVPFEFVLSKDTVKDGHEFDSLVTEAKARLKQDLKRCRLDLETIPSMLRKKLTGIGSMTILADDTGKVTVKFHKRNGNGLWDGESKKYPEKDTKAKYKSEIFFILEDEEDED